ncbi:MAG: hypothetical protein M1819_002889 [Sarea resinae]|nr:MAG: hypothetical protein M1819_002889 [Sarea resinae]
MEGDPRGVKRPAQDNLDNDQRLVKRLGLLNLENNGKLYLPVQHAPPSSPIPSKADNDAMQMDDTKDKVYIYNLDEELAGIESDEEKLIFLPDIEKRMAKIPKSVLTGHNPPKVGNNELVLYNIPASISIPEDQDSVRKAFLEARRRAQDKQAQELQDSQLNGHNVRGGAEQIVQKQGQGAEPGTAQQMNEVKSGSVDMINTLPRDEDAMDIG